MIVACPKCRGTATHWSGKSGRLTTCRKCGAIFELPVDRAEEADKSALLGCAVLAVGTLAIGGVGAWVEGSAYSDQIGTVVLCLVVGFSVVFFLLLLLAVAYEKCGKSISRLRSWRRHNPMRISSNAVLFVGGLLFAMSLLFPPWTHTYQIQGISQVRTPAGYAFLLSPPEPELSPDGTRSRLRGIALDWSRMMAQLGVVVSVMGVFWYIARQGEIINLPVEPTAP